MDLSSIQAKRKTFAGYGERFPRGVFFNAIQPQLILFFVSPKDSNSRGNLKNIFLVCMQKMVTGLCVGIFFCALQFWMEHLKV